MEMLPVAGEGHFQPLLPLTRRLSAEKHTSRRWPQFPLWSQSFASPVTVSPGWPFPCPLPLPWVLEAESAGGRTSLAGDCLSVARGVARGLKLVPSDLSAPARHPPPSSGALLREGCWQWGGVGVPRPGEGGGDEGRDRTFPLTQPKAAWGPWPSPPGPPGSPSEHRDVAQPLLRRPLPDIPAARLPLINA